jgi:hypothetical protein
MVVMLSAAAGTMLADRSSMSAARRGLRVIGNADRRKEARSRP